MGRCGGACRRAAQGQQALFRVLKAYSLHDLEVGALDPPSAAPSPCMRC